MSTVASTVGGTAGLFGGTVETLIVLLIVAVFAWRGLRQLLPSVHRRLLLALRRRLGLAIDATPAASEGCGSGCGPCKGCGSTTDATAARQSGATTAPLDFHPRKP